MLTNKNQKNVVVFRDLDRFTNHAQRFNAREQNTKMMAMTAMIEKQWNEEETETETMSLTFAAIYIFNFNLN